MLANWVTVTVATAIVGLIVFGLWCASRIIKGAVDSIWDMFGW